jgi:inorganic pyrophosphatase
MLWLVKKNFVMLNEYPIISVTVETTKGSGQKFDYDPELKQFKLTKLMPSGMVFPYDFGFVRDTLGEDGDPLDVMILFEGETFVGCAVDCRIVGVITANQKERDGNEVRNDRFIAIPDISLHFKHIQQLSDLSSEIIHQLEEFFKNYNLLAGKDFTVLERLNAREAYTLIKNAPSK